MKRLKKIGKIFRRGSQAPAEPAEPADPIAPVVSTVGPLPGPDRLGSGELDTNFIGLEDADPRPTWPPCHCGCGWAAFPGHTTCCRVCQGPEGPHAKDCDVKNRRAQPPCALGCGRPAFANFSTCCTRCTGSAGEHSTDCARKAACLGLCEPPQGGGDGGGRSSRRYGVPQMPPAGSAGSCKASGTKAVLAPAGSLQDLEEGLRVTLAAWQDSNAACSNAQLDAVVGEMAEDSRLHPDVVRMTWHSVARSTRPLGCSVDVYPGFAKEHYDVDVDVVDIGQYSATRHNSCMFLTCAVSVVYRHQRSSDGSELPNLVRQHWGADEPLVKSTPLEKLIEEHRAEPAGVLGTLADVLRKAACEVLERDEDLYMPFFAPVGRGARYFVGEPQPEDYRRWVKRLEGSEEGDELVMLALAQVCGMAIQAVQCSGYRVPVMDPLCLAEAGGFTAYWGNDDKHWVWLRPS